VALQPASQLARKTQPSMRVQNLARMERVML
jgi:hypothetical protein